MSDNPFALPWVGKNPLLRENVPENPVIGEVVCRLERLLQRRRQFSCPNDDIDNRIISAVQCTLDSIRPLTEQQNLTVTQKNSLIRYSRSLIKEANDVIDKTLKIRSN